MKYFITADVHSFYDALLTALQAKDFDIHNPEHTLVVCGDLFDRGDKSKELLDFVQSLGDRFIYVRGNHEDLLIECMDELKRGMPLRYHHQQNGTLRTITQLVPEYAAFDPFGFRYHSEIVEAMQPILDWINSKTVDYFEIANKYICVHGWLPYGKNISYKNTTRPTDKERWRQARWANGMQRWDLGMSDRKKTVICGHWHCSWGWYYLKGAISAAFPSRGQEDFDKAFEPFIDEGIIALDACTAHSNKVNCIVIDA